MHHAKRLLALGLIAMTLGAGASKPDATLTRFEEQLQIRLTHSLQWFPGKLGQWLAQGDTLRTGLQGRAEISDIDGTVARIGPQALLVPDQHRQTLGRQGATAATGHRCRHPVCH
ncbi:MAG: hypothetical protein H7338_00745 [Candidatus Sericytochromatia bacterium]|nr:hypothetical protein [Candidatus Sericytochromatia bacterium]